MGKGGDGGKGEILAAPIIDVKTDNHDYHGAAIIRRATSAAAAAPRAGDDEDEGVVGADTENKKTAVTNGRGGDVRGGADAEGERAWYVRGGFHVNGLGMAMNVLVPPVVLLAAADSAFFHPLPLTPAQLFLGAVALQMALALRERMVTFFCVVAVPIYLATLLVVPFTLRTSTANVALCLSLAFLSAAWRVGACMSVCLHRYAAHAAFKCSPPTRLLLNLLGCAANQGGPIWWASQHRCHHKHCDLPRDPHSAVRVGVERAFAFFSLGHGGVEEEFAPRHNDTRVLRLVDTFAFSVCSLELYLAYVRWGREGLFVSYTSQWLCQTITLWFNIANHPPGAHPTKDCQAVDSGKGEARAGWDVGWYPGFRFLDAVCPFYSAVASEGAHEDHHVRFMLAKRERYDVMYHTFVRPLEAMGLVWDVKVASPE